MFARGWQTWDLARSIESCPKAMEYHNSYMIEVDKSHISL